MHVVFSGVDGAGKSTQINLLLDYLKVQGQQPIYLWTRGGYTPLFNRLKEVVRRLSRGKAIPNAGPSNQRTQNFGRPAVRKVWLTVAILELFWIYGVQVRWWQVKGKVVICDRYLDDTLLDFQQNFPQENIITWGLWRFLRLVAAKADVTFLLLVPVEESVKRSQQKNEPFPDSPEVLTWRLARYQQLAKQRAWQMIDGRRPLFEIAAEIQQIVEQKTKLPSAIPA